MNNDHSKIKKYVHKIAKRAIRQKRASTKRGSNMGCSRGGSHQWKQMRAKSGASGIMTLQQCKKCSATRETLHPLIILLIVIVLAVIVAGLYQAGTFDQLQQ